jgi:hypothetical protein
MPTRFVRATHATAVSRLYGTRARCATLVGTLTLAALTACGPSDMVGSKRLKPIHKGMTLDSVAAVIGDGPLTVNQPADSLRLFHGFRIQAFFVKGAMYKVLWYREAPGTVEESIEREKETPILLKSDSVLVKGWNDFDDTAQEIGIPDPYREKERVDSIAKTQMKGKPN